MVKDFQNLPDTFPAPQHFSAAFMVERRPGERGCFPRRPSCQSCLLKTPRYLWLRGRSRPALSTRTFCSTEMLCVHAVQQHGGHCPHWGSWNCGQHDRIFTFILVHLNANVKFYFTSVYSNVKISTWFCYWKTFVCLEQFGNIFSDSFYEIYLSRLSVSDENLASELRQAACVKQWHFRGVV